MKPHIKQFFEFLEKKENRQIPLKAKLLNPKDYKIGPEDLNVKGDLDLWHTPIESLPDNLTVEGRLNLFRTQIESLPDNLTVGRTLSLSYTRIKSLPDNLKVGEDLWLTRTPLAQKYTKEQIRYMVEENGGSVEESIVTIW